MIKFIAYSSIYTLVGLGAAATLKENEPNAPESAVVASVALWPVFVGSALAHVTHKLVKESKEARK